VQVGRFLAERYEILRPLAEGAMATVWVAFDKTDELEVAIKTISLDAAGWRAEVRDRFMKEARLLSRAKHEHLVGVRDVGETDDGYLFLVLDLLEGQTLAEHLLSKSKLDWSDAAQLAVGITRGVAALHKAGIVHRDLKPANIVLRQTPAGVVPTIIDLGIGKASDVVGDPLLCATLTATGQVLGTPEYMSYEQALGQTDIDARADVWAIGVMLYEMLAGKRPFEAPNTNAVLAAIRRNEIRPLRDVVPSVPPAIARIVDVCLSTNRSERFADAEALLAQLETPAPTPIEEPAAPEKPQKAFPPAEDTKRRPFVMAIVAASAMLCISGIFLYLVGRSNIPATTENPASVKGSSSPESVTSGVTTYASFAPSAAAQRSSAPVCITAPVKPRSMPSSSAKVRVPVSRVNESGF
jgi:eukaryotic-like serine/threonine-protein kinase